MHNAEPIFVDAVAWIALFNQRDSLHAQAVRVRAELYRQKARLFTTEFVLLETADALTSPLLRTAVARLIAELKRQNAVRVIPVSSELIDAGLDLYARRPDKEWSLTDCISFAVMEQEGCSVALTQDHHFVQAGYGILL